MKVKEYVKSEPQGDKILMIIAPKNFRDEELFDPKRILEEAGYTVVVASKGVNSAISMFNKNTPVDIDMSKKSISVDDYEAVIFVGGTGATQYFDYPTALKIAQDANASRKVRVLGAICIAPSILANAGVLNGKSATCWASEEQNLIKHGAKYTAEHVTIDGKIVTSNGPRAAEEFGKAIVKILGKK